MRRCLLIVLIVFCFTFVSTLPILDSHDPDLDLRDGVDDERGVSDDNTRAASFEDGRRVHELDTDAEFTHQVSEDEIDRPVNADGAITFGGTRLDNAPSFEDPSDEDEDEKDLNGVEQGGSRTVEDWVGSLGRMRGGSGDGTDDNQDSEVSRDGGVDIEHSGALGGNEEMVGLGTDEEDEGERVGTGGSGPDESYEEENEYETASRDSSESVDPLDGGEDAQESTEY
ncbi:hypothetical protein BJ742DRAFT_822015 [Cladochytrium replicatum]|nr:hypothetical protein BJ742DRAFT_822015 [Cladochytrium replicatum]